MTDRFLANKWVILDRLKTLRQMADYFADGHYDESDKRLFEGMSRQVDLAIKEQAAEIQRREGR